MLEAIYKFLEMIQYESGGKVKGIGRRKGYNEKRETGGVEGLTEMEGEGKEVERDYRKKRGMLISSGLSTRSPNFTVLEMVN